MIYELKLKLMIKTRIENGILIAEYAHGSKIDLESAKQMVNERLLLQDGKNYPVVVHLNGIISNSKAVRSYMAKEGIELWLVVDVEAVQCVQTRTRERPLQRR